MSAPDEAKVRRAVIRLMAVENTEHADCCEGCPTCDLFNAVDVWIEAYPPPRRPTPTKRKRK